MRIAYVLGTSSGGTVRHVRMLADGLARRGATVDVYAPAATWASAGPASTSGGTDLVSGGPAAVSGGSASASGGPVSGGPSVVSGGPDVASGGPDLVSGGGPASGGPDMASGGSAGAGGVVARDRNTPRYTAVEIADRPRPARDLAAVRRLRTLLAGTRPDVVHAHGLRAGALAALAAGRGRPRPRLIVTVHNAAPQTGATAAVYRILERLVARRADQVLCVSSDLEARMRGLGARGVARALVPAPPSAAPPDHAAIGRLRAELSSGDPDPAPPASTAPDQAAIGRLSAELGAGDPDPAPSASTAPDQAPREPAAAAGLRGEPAAGGSGPGRVPIVLAVARLAPQKGLGTLVEAARQWQDREPAPLLVFAGDGPLRAELAGQAEGAGVAARFLGQRGDVPALLAAADVVVLPSVWEGQPLIVQETLRAGRPLVASRAGGIPDLTGEDGALLVPPGDAAALAAAVLSVLGDPGVAARLGEAAVKRAALLPSEQDAVDAALAACQPPGAD